MNFVSGRISASCNQALYLLGGWQLKLSSDGAPMRFSVTEIGLDELVPANPEENGGNSKSFTWQNIVTRYKKRSVEFELLNVYQYYALHWKKSGTTVPQLFGYHDRPTWPLSENFSLWTLALFKPWKVKCTEVISDKETYALELTEYMYNDDYPAKIRYIILRAKRNEPDPEIPSVDYIVGNGY